MAEDPNRCIKVPVVIGQNVCEVLVVTEIPLDPPLFEIKDISKSVTVENCLVQDGLVIIDGTLRKNINYNTLDKEEVVPFPDGGLGAQIAHGKVVHTHVWLPFHCFVNIAGALTGDDCQIESAEVVGEKDEPICAVDSEPRYHKLLEKAVIQLVVKVTRTEQVTVSTLTPGVCPV